MADKKSQSSGPGRQDCCLGNCCTNTASTMSFWSARAQDYVLGRIRAGLLEEGTVAPAR